MLRTERAALFTDEQPEAFAIEAGEIVPEAQNGDHFVVAAG